MEPLFAFEWADVQSTLVKLVTAFVVVLPVGWERESRTRIMGLRTFPIVAVATCAYVLISIDFTSESPDAQARIIQGLITGMGFIGGGAILKNENGVTGTATAASLWATGAVGAAVAYGRLEMAIVVSLILFVTLRFLTGVETKLMNGDEKPGVGRDAA